jgi:hypothetical protein
MDRDGKIEADELQTAVDKGTDLNSILDASAHEDWHDMDTLRCIAGTALMHAPLALLPCTLPSPPDICQVSPGALGPDG